LRYVHAGENYEGNPAWPASGHRRNGKSTHHGLLDQKVVTLTYSRLHENSHYLMCQKHAATRQPDTGAITL